MDELLSLRQQIDEVNIQLLSLLKKRMLLSDGVAQYKMEHNMPVYNEEREKAILEQVSSLADQFDGAAKVVFQTLMDVSRARQYSLMNGGDKLRKTIKNSTRTSLSDYKGIIACPGVEGSYSNFAAKKLFPINDIKFYKRFEDVFKAVYSNEILFGVVPVENSLAGSVSEIYDYLSKYNLYIVCETTLEINHCLAVKKGLSFNNIKNVCSHPQALSQCSDIISHNDWHAIPYTNTAAAAKAASQSEDDNLAVICSSQAAKQYGLNILKESIQNLSYNQTRFIAISKNLIISPDANKISLSFCLPHIPGSLYRALMNFSVYGLNLTKIESRPIQGKGFEYCFYVDFTGSVFDEDTINLLCSMSEDFPAFSFLGNYPCV